MDFIKTLKTPTNQVGFELLQWLDNHEKLKAHIQRQIPQHISPKRVFYAGIEYCCHNKIELPSYHFLASFITEAYNVVENDYVHNITQKLTDEQREKLDHILKPAASTETEASPLPSFTHLKKINQSLRPMDIRESAAEFKLFKNYFNAFESVINNINISNKMTEYYEAWTQKATLFQLNQFPNPYKSYLHLLCYLKHQFYVRHDLLVDILIKSSQNSLNEAQKKENEADKKNKANAITRFI